MERPIFDVDSDDEEKKKNPHSVESAPPQEQHLERADAEEKVGSRLSQMWKELLGSDDEDDEDEEPSKLKSLLSKPPKAEVEEVEQLPEAESRKSGFSLSVLGEAEPEAEQLVQPHHIQPEEIVPDNSDSEIYDFDQVPGDPPENVPEADDNVLAPPPRQPQPPQQQATHETVDIDTEPGKDVPTPPVPPIYGMGGGVAPPGPPADVFGAVGGLPAAAAEAAMPTIDTDDFATHREVNRKATLAAVVGVGAGMIANSKARNRTEASEQRSTQRTEDVRKEVEFNKRQAEAQQSRLREDLEYQRLEAEKRAKMATRTIEERPVERPLPKPETPKTASRPVVEQAPQPRPLRETYSPDVHDSIPPKEAFEKLTGMEQPQPRSIEQERRFEVKDEPGKVPVSYTQVDPHESRQQTSQQSPQSARSTLMNLNPTPAPTPTQSKTKNPIHPTYKKAAVSGLITGLVILAVLLALVIL